MNRLDTQQLVSDARGRWPGILQALGIDAKYLKNEHGPCPICGGKDRFRFDDKDGDGTFYCSKCGCGDGLYLLRQFRGWDFPRTKREVAAIVGTVPAAAIKPEQTDEDKIRYALSIWKEAKPITPGDPVWLYLQRRCGITEAPLEIRYHPSLKHAEDGGLHPAMIARMTTPDRKPCGVQRVYLTHDGQKASVNPQRKEAGKMGAVRLAPSGPVLGIAEGIETALCAGMRFQVPVWSGICAHGLETWTPPETVSRVLICGDNDANFTGQSAAYTLARRLRMAGLEVEIKIPEREGCDWADEEVA